MPLNRPHPSDAAQLKNRARAAQPAGYLPVRLFATVRQGPAAQLRPDRTGPLLPGVRACGLEWDDVCLDFHKTDRSIRTASVTQVRQPIYNTSLERWRHYDAFLDPLFDALGDLAPKHD